jgi:hypothetical protein
MIYSCKHPLLYLGISRARPNQAQHRKSSPMPGSVRLWGPSQPSWGKARWASGHGLSLFLILQGLGPTNGHGRAGPGQAERARLPMAMYDHYTGPAKYAHTQLYHFNLFLNYKEDGEGTFRGIWWRGGLLQRTKTFGRYRRRRLWSSLWSERQGRRWRGI